MPINDDIITPIGKLFDTRSPIDWTPEGIVIRARLRACYALPRHVGNGWVQRVHLILADISGDLTMTTDITQHGTRAEQQDALSTLLRRYPTDDEYILELYEAHDITMKASPIPAADYRAYGSNSGYYLPLGANEKAWPHMYRIIDGFVCNIGAESTQGYESYAPGAILDAWPLPDYASLQTGRQQGVFSTLCRVVSVSDVAQQSATPSTTPSSTTSPGWGSTKSSSILYKISLVDRHSDNPTTINVFPNTAPGVLAYASSFASAASPADLVLIYGLTRIDQWTNFTSSSRIIRMDETARLQVFANRIERKILNNILESVAATAVSANYVTPKSRFPQSPSTDSYEPYRTTHSEHDLPMTPPTSRFNKPRAVPDVSAGETGSPAPHQLTPRPAVSQGTPLTLKQHASSKAFMKGSPISREESNTPRRDHGSGKTGKKRRIVKTPSEGDE